MTLKMGNAYDPKPFLLGNTYDPRQYKNLILILG